MEKRKYKFLAFILILSLIFPFFPFSRVSAESLAFLPVFPYDQDNYYNVNNGSFALWQIHNSNYLTYVQTFTPNNISYPNPIIIFNKTWLASNYTYYLDYSYIIDSWDISGLHSDGFAGTQNIRVPNPNSDFVSDNVVYATLLYTTDNVIWKNGTDFGVYAYTNFYPDGYSDPTPTPIPQPVIKEWDSYPQIPSNFSSSTLCILRTHCDGVNDGELIGISWASGDSSFNYPTFYKDRTSYNYRSQAFIDNAITINTWSRHGWNFSTFIVNYDDETDSYSVVSNLNGVNTAPGDDVWYTSNKLDWNGETLCCWSLVSDNPLIVSGLQAGSYMNSSQSWFEILFTNHNITPGTSVNPNVSPTPTPTAIPTAIPQPTENPNPTSTPEPDIKIVQPSDHWWDGLIKPIQYIFVPSQDKMMRTYNIMSEKFGVQKPTKFEFSVDSLMRPNNVVWNFKYVSIDGNDNTETQITLIDFEMVDGWLETSAGQMIIRIIRAVFGLLMWAYLMYIYRKHIATINYTDAETLKDVSRNNGGGDEDV